MKILIDIGHPAHVHYFRNFAKESIKKGHHVIFTARNKEFTIQLLEFYGFEFVSFGKPFKSKLGKVFGLLYFTLRLTIVALKFRPDLFLHATMYSAVASWLLRKPHISLEDTFNMEQVKLYLPFTNVVLSPDCPHISLGEKEIQYSGYQELLYLHPDIFTPDSSVLEELNIKKGEKFVIIRFVSWHASHDYGHQGISLENKLKAVKEFSQYAKVIISSERQLPFELRNYAFDLHPSKMHHLMAYASLIFGESATMVSEGAMLGIPGIYLDNIGRCYTSEQEKKYNLVSNFSESEEDQLAAIKKGVEILKSNISLDDWLVRRNKMLEDKINVTSFLIWFIENYPDSFHTMKDNPDYQYRFS